MNIITISCVNSAKPKIYNYVNTGLGCNEIIRRFEDQACLDLMLRRLWRTEGEVRWGVHNGILESQSVQLL